MRLRDALSRAEISGYEGWEATAVDLLRLAWHGTRHIWPFPQIGLARVAIDSSRSVSWRCRSPSSEDSRG
jgi:hypothetical protein